MGAPMTDSTLGAEPTARQVELLLHRNDSSAASVERRRRRLRLPAASETSRSASTWLCTHPHHLPAARSHTRHMSRPGCKPSSLHWRLRRRRRLTYMPSGITCRQWMLTSSNSRWKPRRKVLQMGVLRSLSPTMHAGSSSQGAVVSVSV